MKEIITDLSKLMDAAKPLKLVDEKGAISKKEGTEIMASLKEILKARQDLVALSAPQIGINARVICIKFKDAIKTFINPVITKKLNYFVKPETCASMPGQEILITRPEEVTVVYHNDEFKYEENKLLGAAARFFDQQYQFLDGIVPSELGLVSSVETDGSLSELSTDELTEIVEKYYKPFIQSKISTMEKEIGKDPELIKEYKQLKFTESVIRGHAALVTADKETTDRYKKAQATAALSLKNYDKQTKAANRANLSSYLRKKGK